MTEHPILFRGPMVRAILDGRKTVTRRVAKPGPGRFAVGDRLWVRETWRYRGCIAEDKPPQIDRTVYYRVDDEGRAGPWKPSIFLPRRHSRLTLEVVSVRAERLHEITPHDIIEEGVAAKAGEGWLSELTGEFYRFDQLLLLWKHGWDSINGKRPGCSWEDNPMVWRIEFRRLP